MKGQQAFGTLDALRSAFGRVPLTLAIAGLMNAVSSLKVRLWLPETYLLVEGGGRLLFANASASSVDALLSVDALERALPSEYVYSGLSVLRKSIYDCDSPSP